MLADALSGTGVLGNVHEYFWRLVEPMHAAELGLEAPADAGYATYLEAALRYGTTPNGVFGAKLFWAHAVDLVRRTGLMPEYAGLGALERLWAPFGDDVRLVFLRRNCLRSALSLWRAEVTQEWGRRPGASLPQPPATVDVRRVSELHAGTHAADVGWRAVLEGSALPVLEMAYGTVVADLNAAVRDVAQFAGVELPMGLHVDASYVRQADELTDRFETMWAEATGGCADCTPGAQCR